MADSWRITVKGMTGSLISVDVANPQETTVLDLKRLIHQKEPNLLPYLQRVVHQISGGGRTKLEDDCKLSSYPDIRNGSTLFLVRLPLFELYVHDVRGNLIAVSVPSSEPETFSIADLRCVFEEKTGQKLDEYQFQYKGRPVDETRHGKQLTLRTYNIKSHDTLFVMKIGFSLDITNPQVDLCFMVDCTGSMSGSIEAVRSNVKQLRDRLDTEYKGCDIRFAFVRYTDYDQPAATRTTFLDFTKSQSSFYNFVNPIRADGGGDGPEDIMGGLKVVFTRLSWRPDATKVLIHIADAPCHGTQYHSGGGDSYPNGDPAGISHDHMMEEVTRRDVQYWFGYVNKSSTDTMISVFNESLRRQSSNRLMIRQFDAMQSSEVGEGVHNAVTSSVYAKAAKKASVRRYTLDSNIPNWTSGLLMEQQAKKTSPLGVLTLQHLQDGFVLDRPSVPISFKCASNPFAEGEESVVFHAHDFTNKRHIVLKQRKRDGIEHNSIEVFMKILEVHAVAATYAREFNAEKEKPSNTDSVEFIPLDVVECPGKSCFVLEPFTIGKFEKFNNNSGVVFSKSPLSPLLQAFSHYSWEKSGKSVLICDLQGVKNGSKVLLTDPAIHSRSGGATYGITDLGFEGIQRFIKTHECSHVCLSLGLTPLSL